MVRVHVSVQAVNQLELQLVDKVCVALDQFNNWIDNNSLVTNSVSQKIGVSTRISIKELPKEEIVNVQHGEQMLTARARNMHADHITGTGRLKQHFSKCRSAISSQSEAQADCYLEEGDAIKFGPFSLRVLYTPGHTVFRCIIQ